MQVTGKENRLDFQKMNNKWKNDFERNSLSTFEIVAPQMGKLHYHNDYDNIMVILILGDITSVILKKAGLDDWLCDYVLITDTSTGKNWQFNFAGEKIAKCGTSGKIR